MPLPAFREDGWLPEGHHTATWEEIEATFCGAPTSRRALVLSSLLRWRDTARSKGMGGLVVLDGSFVSGKESPGDFDLVFIYDDETRRLVGGDEEARALTDYQACKRGFDGDVFAFSSLLQRLSPMLSGTGMFDFDRQRRPKGVVEVPL